MEGEGAAGVCSGHDLDPPPMREGQKLADLVEGAPIGDIILRPGRVRKRLHRVPPPSYGHVIEVVRGARRHRAGAVQRQVLVDHEGRVQRDLAVDQALQGRLDRRAVEVDLRQAPQRGEAKQGAGVFIRLEDPAQHQLVDVGDLIVAGVDHRIGRRERRHVAQHAHALCARLGDHRRDPGRLDGGIDLDVVISARGVPADRLDRRRFAVDDKPRLVVRRAIALDHPRTDHVGAGEPSRVHVLDEAVQDGVVRSQVAHGGHAGEHVP